MERGRRVAGEELIGVAEVMVKTEAALIVVVRHDLSGREERRREIAEWVKLFRLLRDGTDQERGDFVPGELLAGEFVDERDELAAAVDETREVSRTLGGCGDNGGSGFTLAIALSFVVDEEKIFVAADGTSQGCAELILVKRFGAGGEKVAGIERVVAKEIVEVAVKGVRAGFGDDGSSSAAGFAVLGGSVGSQDAEFVDGVDRSAQGEAAVDAIDVADAIEEIVVGLGWLPVHRVSLTAASDAACLCQAKGNWRDAGLEKAELGEVAAIQRQINRFASGDDVAESGADIDGCGVGSDVDEIASCADVQGHGKIDGAVDIDANGLGFEPGETAGFDA